MGIEVIISAFIANFITGFVKPVKGYSLSDEEKAARTTIIRIMNAVFALIALVATSYLSGDSLDVTQLSGAIEAVVGLVVTFFVGQGGYAMFKK